MIKSGTCMKNSCAQNFSFLGSASSASAGGVKVVIFQKKAWNLTFRFDITVSISLFIASYNLVVGCT